MEASGLTVMPRSVITSDAFMGVSARRRTHYSVWSIEHTLEWALTQVNRSPQLSFDEAI
jgi:hypothetical protein